MTDIIKLKLGKLSFSPPLVLAPMVGLSHSALRLLVMELGGIGLLYSEMLSAQRLPQENENVSPLLIRSDDEQPLFYQVFLSDCSPIEGAVAKLHQLDAQGIDINFGCPAPNLRKRGAGCSLAEDHGLVKKIVRQFRSETNLPLTAKIRLGEGPGKESFLELCRIIEGEGADGLIIHARMNREKFCRKPKWSWIRTAKEQIEIPVIANGGVFSVGDAKKCLELSNADGLMIGRGGVEKPWLFSQIAAGVYNVETITDIYPTDVYRRFIELLNLRFSPERRLGRLKQFTHYFASNYLYGHRLASVIQTSDSMEQAIERSELFFQTNNPLPSGGEKNA